MGGAEGRRLLVYRRVRGDGWRKKAWAALRGGFFDRRARIPSDSEIRKFSHDFVPGTASGTGNYSNSWSTKFRLVATPGRISTHAKMDAHYCELWDFSENEEELRESCSDGGSVRPPRQHCTSSESDAGDLDGLCRAEPDAQGPDGLEFASLSEEESGGDVDVSWWSAALLDASPAAADEEETEGDIDTSWFKSSRHAEEQCSVEAASSEDVDTSWFTSSGLSLCDDADKSPTQSRYAEVAADPPDPWPETFAKVWLAWNIVGDRNASMFVARFRRFRGQ